MQEELFQAGQIIVSPALSIWDSIINYLPGLIGAVLTVILGYIVGGLISILIKTALNKTKLQDWVESTGRSKALGGVKAPILLAGLVKWWIFIAFLAPAAELIKLTPLSNMLYNLAVWLPHLLAAVIIIMVGLILADFAGDKVMGAKSLKSVKFLSGLSKTIILIFFLSIALDEMGMRIRIAENSFLIIIAGLTLTVSLILGIGFGFAFRSHADKFLKKLEKKL